jgi:hypothetical protein
MSSFCVEFPEDRRMRANEEFLDPNSCSDEQVELQIDRHELSDPFGFVSHSRINEK